MGVVWFYLYTTKATHYGVMLCILKLQYKEGIVYCDVRSFKALDRILSTRLPQCIIHIVVNRDIATHMIIGHLVA